MKNRSYKGPIFSFHLSSTHLNVRNIENSQINNPSLNSPPGRLHHPADRLDCISDCLDYLSSS